MKRLVLLLALTTSAMGQDHIAPLEYESKQVTSTWPRPNGWTSCPDPRKNYVWTKGKSEPCEAGWRSFEKCYRIPEVGSCSFFGADNYRCVGGAHARLNRCRSTGESNPTTGTDTEWIWKQQGKTIWVHEEKR